MMKGKEQEKNIFLDEEMNGDRSNIFDDEMDMEKKRNGNAGKKQAENIFNDFRSEGENVKC